MESAIASQMNIVMGEGTGFLFYTLPVRVAISIFKKIIIKWAVEIFKSGV